MSESLRSAFAARLLLRKEQLDTEKQLKENRLRLSHREEWYQQGLLFFPDDRAEKVPASPFYTRRRAPERVRQGVMLCFYILSLAIKSLVQAVGDGGVHRQMFLLIRSSYDVSYDQR